ncbi:hypothetical protein HMPREF9141_1243 [Prevotella multiformis DSM 16608]|uniref:Uncharacterized protein n=1 Tax=Prevotella multiformis DSM 16608 TaxID=888743 RepID=F0F6M1_9BACT|nr:hypothetical protein HMPREF9141_1243 [Prevotella multiformis DSM 16608]
MNMNGARHRHDGRRWKDRPLPDTATHTAGVEWTACMEKVYRAATIK